ncbi:MAG TPA: DUF305 domain-containing protein [Alphaproteobacteria bacterium]|nr:DUF305 domain-containing protein [Alphaproteobacteria bacterium]
MLNSRIATIATLGLALTCAPVALAADPHHGHTMAAKPSDTPSTKEFRAANELMHKGMDITFSGDADVDFVKGMIPHHQGAVDMAKIVLKYGKDPELKKLANDIIKAQETEIKFMRDWLKKNGKAQP